MQSNRVMKAAMAASPSMANPMVQPTTANTTTNKGTLTSAMGGCPVNHNKNSLTAGPTGPVLMQDSYLLEKIKLFVREKIPPRNVHALGYGGHGVFTATNPEITKYSKAKVFEAGKTTPFAGRFSGVFTELGENDTNRDIRGFAMKFKTEEGIWDLLTVNLPVFNVRDMKLGPDTVHSLKRDPRTGMKNINMPWDYVNHHPEGWHTQLMFYTDRIGTPASFRTQNWFGANTYSFVNAEGERFFVRYHLTTDLGWVGLNVIQAKIIAGEDPQFLGRDLKEAIDAGNFPKWKMSVQIITEEQGYANPSYFDCTKAWKHADHPLVELGIVEVNKNPIDHFTEVEEVAFSPARVVPGLGFSPDKLLQGRLLVYDDAQQHRIGPNFHQLPINCPLNPINNNYTNGGNMQMQYKDKFPNYSGSNYPANEPMANPTYADPPLRVDGPANYYDLVGEGTDEDYYGQPREFLRVQDPKEFTDMCFNIGSDLFKCDAAVRDMSLMHMSKISPKLSEAVQKVIQEHQTAGPRTESEKMVKAIEAQLKAKSSAI